MTIKGHQIYQYTAELDKVKTLLFTGFEKFLDHPFNPSEMLATELQGNSVGEYKVISEIIPLKFYDIKNLSRNIIDKHKPDAIIMTGLAMRPVISLEKVAINYANSNGVPYNCGTKTKDEILEGDGPAAYFSTLPIKKIIKNLNKSKIPAIESLTAGAFGCNQIFYETMYYLERWGMDIPAGFIHVPPIPEQVIGKKTASVPLDYQIKTMKKIIEIL